MAAAAWNSVENRDDRSDIVDHGHEDHLFQVEKSNILVYFAESAVYCCRFTGTLEVTAPADPHTY